MAAFPLSWHLSSCSRDCMAHKAKHIYCSTLYRESLTTLALSRQNFPTSWTLHCSENLILTNRCVLIQICLLQLLEKYLCNTNLMKLLVKTLCEPSSIGFNISDVHIMNHLPDVCVNLMKALKKSPYKDILERNLKEKITAQRWAFGSCSGSGLGV